MGCCHSRKHSPSKENSPVASKSAVTQSNGNCSHSLTRGRKLQRSRSGSGSGSGSEEYLYHERVAQRDLLECQRRQNELDQLKKNRGFVSHESNNPPPNSLGKTAEKPIIELTPLPHSDDNLTGKVKDATAEPPRRTHIDPKLVNEDDGVFSEPEKEEFTVHDDAVLSRNKFPDADATSPKSNEVEQQPSYSSSSRSRSVSKQAAAQSVASTGALSDKILLIASSSSQQEQATLHRNVPEDSVIKKDASPAICRQVLYDFAETDPMQSTAVVEQIYSTCEESSQLSLSTSNAGKIDSDDPMRFALESKIIIKTIPPPPSPLSKEKAEMLQVARPLDKEATPQHLDDRKSDHDVLQPTLALELDESAEVMPKKESENPKNDVNDYLFEVVDSKMYQENMTHARHGNKPLSSLNVAIENSTPNAPETAKEEAKLWMLSDSTEMGKQFDETNSFDSGRATDAQLQVILTDVAPITTSVSALGSEQDATRGLAEHVVGLSDRQAFLNNNFYSHLDPKIDTSPARLPIPDILMQPFPDSRSSRSPGLAEDATQTTLTDAARDDASREAKHKQEHLYAVQSVENVSAATTQLLSPEPNGTILDAVSDVKKIKDTNELEHRPAVPKQVFNLKDHIAQGQGEMSRLPPPRRLHLPPPLPSPNKDIHVQGTESSETE